MALRIYPSIGVARIGNDLDRFFVGPEIPGHPGVEIDAAGNETVVGDYKVDDDQIKRQAARFRIFDVPEDGGPPREVELPVGAVVEWTVHLVNKKAAVRRRGFPPQDPARPELVADPAPLLIDPGARTIAGAGASGVKFDTGEYQGRRVPLGELRTDSGQRLLVLGGFGFSSSPTNKPLPSFYDNPGWHDDTSDGPVTARIRFGDGRPDVEAAPAWVIVGPPDFAPDIQGIVTLYDIMEQVAVDHFSAPLPAPVSFTRDVFPLIRRARRLEWVSQAFDWSDISEDWAALADASAAAAQPRVENAARVRSAEERLSSFSLTDVQQHRLDRWVAGDFDSDWTGVPDTAATVTPDGMTRAALASTVGQGFFPGIEGGIITKDPTLYAQPFDFRLDPASVGPGDITALMALPWQADFYDCRLAWWPAQRPDGVRLSAASPDRGEWDRGVGGHLSMVHNFPKLGFITAQKDAQGNVVFVETQRADLTQLVV